MYLIKKQMQIQRIIITILAVVILQVADAQGVLRGVVLDKDTQEPIIGATIHDAKKGKPLTVSNAEGRFTIPKNSDTQQIRITYISYKSYLQGVVTQYACPPKFCLYRCNQWWRLQSPECRLRPERPITCHHRLRLLPCQQRHVYRLQ